MGFVDYVKQGLQIVRLKGNVASEIAKDKNAFGMGLIIIAMGGIACGIVSNSLQGIVIMPIIMVSVYFMAVGILHVIALLFGGSASYMELFRTSAVASVLGWGNILSIIPIVGYLVIVALGIWGMIVNVVIVENVHQLTRAKAIVVVLVGVIITATIAQIFFKITA